MPVGYFLTGPYLLRHVFIPGLFITYVVVDNTSAQNILGSLACASILRTLSMMIRFILSASPFSSWVFGTVNSSRIPFERQYSSNCPRYLLLRYLLEPPSASGRILFPLLHGAP